MAFNNRAKLDVPKGFRNLLEGLTLEVLRVKPTNIPKFAAEYFKERLVLRQERGYDECLLGSQIDGFYHYEPNRPENTNKLLDMTVQDSLKSTSVQPPPTSATTLSEDEAALKIQAGFHGYKVRQEIELQNRSAEKIQAGYRGYACRKDIKNKNEAASKIQAGFRGQRVRRGKETAGQDHEETGKEYQTRQTGFQDENVAATKIQAGFRGYQARKGTKTNGENTRQAKIEDENEAANKIQARFRGYQVRKGRGSQSSMKKILGTSLSSSHCNGEKLHEKLPDKEEAAKRIQAGYRGYRDRKEIARQNKASSKIQAGYRGYKDRKELKMKKGASVKIQAAYRGYHDRKELETKHKASTTIQAGYRGHKVRKIKINQSEAAVKIQAQYRGYRVRKGIKSGGETLNKNQIKLLDIAHQDSRFSFSLPQEDVKFEGNLDSDSDTDIDKVVNKIEAKKTEIKEDKKDDANGDKNQV